MRSAECGIRERVRPCGETHPTRPERGCPTRAFRQSWNTRAGHPRSGWVSVFLLALLLLPLALRAQPHRDPAGQPFRRAPMAEAARSIVIPLATNLHVAFDTELFRTHTAWSGPGLGLHGQPFDGGTNRFLCDFPGPALWSNPPVFPWWLGSPSKKGLREMPARYAFRGLSTKGGATTFLYELTPTDEDPVRIHETPRAAQSGGVSVVVRRLEISPCPLDLEFLAHAEVGKFVALENTPIASALLERENDVLLIAARGRPALYWKLTVAPADYITERNTEQDGDTEVLSERVTRDEARAQLVIPSHSGDVAVEIVSAVCANRAEALKLLPDLIRVRVQPADLDFPASRTNLAATNAALVLPSVPPAVRAPAGDEAYRVEWLGTPAQTAWRVTGMDWVPNGDLALCTLAGEVWIAQQAQGGANAITWRRFARGLCEPGGLKVVAGVLYVAQKCELTRLVDTNADGEADLFECVSQRWSYLGSPLQFTVGPEADAERNLHVQLDGRRNAWDQSFRAWTLKLSPAGELDGFARGLHSPGGLLSVFGAEWNLFATDNAGPWVGVPKLVHLRADHHFGYPASNPAPQTEFKGGTAFAPPAVWFPATVAKAAGGLAATRFGPTNAQLLVTDPSAGSLLRVDLEKVNGEWQGAVWPLVTNLGAGAGRIAVGPEDQRFYVGFNALAGAGAGQVLARVSPVAASPFAVQELRATPSGFTLTFTQPVEAASAGRPASYAAEQFKYLHHEADGSPEVDHAGGGNSASLVKVTQAVVSADRLTVRLTVEGWQAGFVTRLRAAGVRNAAGQRLRHDTLHYTLNTIPQ